MDGAVAAEANRKPVGLPREIGPLTSLRFFAAAIVLFFHYGAHAAVAAKANVMLVTFLQNGYLGVSFFFLLSGFILTVAYKGRLGSAADVGRFFIARFARIYPVYLLALILALPVDGPDNLFSAALTPILLQSWGAAGSTLGLDWNYPSWTLSVEALFYIAFPLLLPRLLSAPTRMVSLLLAVLLTATAVFNLAAVAPGVPKLLVFEAVPLPLLRLPEFMVGVTLAVLLTRSVVTPNRWADAGFCALTVLLIAAMALTPEASRIMPLGFAGLIVCATLSVGPIRSLLSLRWLVFLGGASYAIYLLQSPVNGYFDAAFGSSLLGRILMPVALVVIAAIVFRLFEERARRWLRSTITRSRAPESSERAPSA